MSTLVKRQRFRPTAGSRLLIPFALFACGAALSGCGSSEEPSSTSPVAVEASQETQANEAAVETAPRFRWLETASVEELLTPQAIRASLEEAYGGKWEIEVHEIAAVDREGERPGSRVHGEAVVEIEVADQRLLTMVVLIQYRPSKPAGWRHGILSPCQYEPEVVQVTNEPSDEELAWFREACRVVRVVTMAGAADEPVAFRYGYVNPQRTWVNR
ncbi:MAG TPA: hypothetical protein VGN57_07195 [Pirellulaceae bacterium]|jgi:hypothetical protein|nr:hypothetical protein [Pirellulaceae bacterium]